MRTNYAVIGVGSNINAEENIQRMLEILGEKVTVIKVSRMLKTKAVGVPNQPDYTNGAVKIATTLEQDALVKLLKSIEDNLGRDRTVPNYCPRTMDLDLIVWNDNIVDDDYYTRDFLQNSVQEVISA